MSLSETPSQCPPPGTEHPSDPARGPACEPTSEVTPRRPAAAARPAWLRARMPGGPNYRRINAMIEGQELHTVCKSANCPNVGECWEQGTTTFMINGDICTRSCTFCAIGAGCPQPPDPDEPRRVADVAARMRLDHVVITAVTRDDLSDGGAAQFAATLRALRERLPEATREVLIPDFQGDTAALDVVFRERPEVLNHNIETVPRLYESVRPQAWYPRSLEVLAASARAGLVTKSGIMLGLGETAEEIGAVLRDMRAAGVHLVTIGQYLSPSPAHHPIDRYATPEEFEHWRRFGLELGFTHLDSGPLVRSSYHAKNSYHRTRSESPGQTS